MKVRNGFVSNSSSSSFVMVGVKIDFKWDRKDQTDLMEKMGFDWKKEANSKDWWNFEEITNDDKAFNEFFSEEFLYNFLTTTDYVVRSDTEDGVEKDSTVIGIEVVASEDWGLGQAILSMRDISDLGDKIKKEFNLDGEPKLYCGTRCC